MGPIENAAIQEGAVPLIFAIGTGIGPFFYRMAPPDQL